IAEPHVSDRHCEECKRQRYKCNVSHISLRIEAPSSVVKTGVKGQDYSYNQQMLRWRQTRNSRLHLAIIKKSATRSARIVPAVLKPYDGIRLPIWNAVFERAGHSFDSLRESGPAA